jgi:hypothetical protein
MSTVLKYLVGPELIWILACLWASTFKRINFLRDGQYNKLIENYAMFLPVVMIGLTMVLYAFPMVPRKFLMLRIAIVAFIGTNFLMEYVLNAHTEGGPGVGMIYMVAYGFALFAIPVAIVIKHFFIK